MQANPQLDRSGSLRRSPFAGRRVRTAAATGFLLASFVAGSFVTLSATPGLAGECNTDIAALMKKRQGIIDALNKQAKASPKGQLDPTTACGKLRTLAAAERELLAYFVKNKDWCMVPDNAIASLTAGSKKTAGMAANACRVAEQIKKGQDAINNAAPKLPTGPL
jgi:hypothetical protein